MLRQANKVKRIIASGGGDLTVPSGKSYLVRRIEVVPGATHSYVTLSVDRVTVAIYRVLGRAGNHLSSIVKGNFATNIMDFLATKGINVMIPLAEGQTLNISHYAEAGNNIIVYDEYAAGDIRSDMPNVSMAAEYTFLQYMSTSQTPTASQDLLLDISLSPAEFPDFPCAKSVPANHRITMLGLVGHPFTTGAAGPNAWGTTFIKLIKDREVLFDEDRHGIPFDGQDAAAVADAYMSNFSLIGSCTDCLLDTAVRAYGLPLMFDPPLVFEPGQELNIYLSGIMTTAAAWEETMVSIAAILKVQRI